MPDRISIFFLNLLISYGITYCADISYMKTSIRNYFADTRHHDDKFRDYKKAAKEYIHDEFVRYGLKTEYHTFQEKSVSAHDYFQTVVGVLRGDRFGKPDDRIVGLGAHYDTRNTTKGVDDNGAGLAAMLEVARQLTEMNTNGVTRKNTIIFAAFDLEEYGSKVCQRCLLESVPLAGSRHFLEEWLPRFLMINYYKGQPMVQGVIIMDTMMEFNTSEKSQIFPTGAEILFSQFFPDAFRNIASDNFRGDFLNLIYRQPTNDSNIARAFNTSWKEAGNSMFQLELFPLPLDPFNSDSMSGDFKSLAIEFIRSDHGNFWAEKIPAIWLTDSANFRGDMIQCYHHMCDNLEVMLTDDNINFLGKTADVITDTMHGLSEPSGSGKRRTQDDEPNTIGAGGVIGIIIGVILLQIPLVVAFIQWRKSKSSSSSQGRSQFDNHLYDEPNMQKNAA